MLGKPHILSLFPQLIIHLIKHEHSCKILYVFLEILASNGCDYNIRLALCGIVNVTEIEDLT